jgi:membrane-associated phospholipid phosphatase
MDLPRQTRDRLLLFAAAVAAIIAAHLLDPWFYAHFRVTDIYDDDWGRLLRVMGYLPLWLAAALALGLHEGSERGYRRAVLLAAAPVIAGIAGEILKLVFRRERPGAHEGHYFIRSFSERTFSTSGLALPSSHAIVAFGAAAILSRLFPRAWPVWWALAWGCGLSRTAAGAHFFSDIVVAAGAAWLVVAILWQEAMRRGPLTRTARSQS